MLSETNKYTNDQKWRELHRDKTDVPADLQPQEAVFNTFWRLFIQVGFSFHYSF